MGVFYLAIPVGTALGYLLGGYMGPVYGWRAPFYVGAAPGVLLALLLLFIPEPTLGQFDTPESKAPERDTLKSLFRNPAFLTATLGMAMMTFALGGLQVWFPTFLHRARGYTLFHANIIFGLSTLVNGLVASLAGGWISDWLLRRTKSAHYLVSAVSLGLGIPAMCVALFTSGRTMVVGVFVAEFFLLLNTGPLNAAIVNSVNGMIRATAISVNLFCIHFFGDTFSPQVIGAISDRSNLSIGLGATLVFLVISCTILFAGARFAPMLEEAGNEGARDQGNKNTGNQLRLRRKFR